VAAAALTAASFVTAGAASAATTCPTTPSDRVPGIQVQDPTCEPGAAGQPTTTFTALPGATVYTGVLRGSAYRIEVPDHWNRRLVMYAHGYAGTGPVVSVSNPQLRSWYVEHGYAWAASSYRQNGYDVGSGVRDTHDLMTHFSALTHQRAPRETYMTGVSMGGEITAVALERYRGQFTAAMPACGVLGGNRLFDYFLGANATAFALTDAPLQYPDTVDEGTAYTPQFAATVQQQVMPDLGIAQPTPTTFSPGLATPDGQAWSAALQQISGGTRPGFDGAVRYWNSFGFGALNTVPFLFGVYPGLTGGTIGYADGNVADNSGTTYQLDGDPAVSPAEAELNADVLRVDATATRTTNPARTELPEVAGKPRVPVMSLHDLGDLFVPFSMEQVYARQVAAHGSDLFVSRAIRGTGHCEFSDTELATAFSDLVDWVHTGKRAAGDAVLDPAAVSDPAFGCRFTDPAFDHVWFGGACPKA
jgi:hypothetical protein